MYGTYCKLKELKGCKDADVSRATGITKSTFSDWKNGRSEPKKDKLQKIADYFGVTVDYLMSGEDKFKETPYFIDDEAREIAQEIANRKDLKILFDTTRDVSAEDLKFVIELVDKIKKGQDVD